MQAALETLLSLYREEKVLENLDVTSQVRLLQCRSAQICSPSQDIVKLLSLCTAEHFGVHQELVRSPVTETPLLGLQTVVVATQTLTGILRRLAPSVLLALSQNSPSPDGCSNLVAQPASPQLAQSIEFSKARPVEAESLHL